MRVHVMWIWPADEASELLAPAPPPPERKDVPEDAMTLLRLLRELRGYL